MKLSNQGAARIVAATKRDERRPRGGGVPPRARPPLAGSGGFWAQITSDSHAADQGAGPRSSLTGDANAGKYSFNSVYYGADGTATQDSEVVGDRTAADGFAREINGLTNVPLGAIVFMQSIRIDPATSHYFHVFRYDLVILARTKVVTSYPSAAGVFFGCESQALSGNPAEGAPGTITTLGDTFFALNVGSVVPPQGTPILCARAWTTRGVGAADNGSPPQPYWAFRYDG